MPATAHTNLLRSLHRMVSIGLGGILGIVILVQVYGHYRDFSTLAARMREEHLNQQQQLVKREVQRVAERIRYQQSILQELATEKARLRVDQAQQMALNLLNLSEKQQAFEVARKSIMDALAAMRFDAGNGYFFVLDRRGVLLRHPTRPQMEQQALLEYTDTRGKRFVEELVNLAMTHGAGSLAYTFTKPGSDSDAFEKVSYARYIEELDFIIGTGVYLDDLESAEKARLLNEIQQTRYGKNGYLFVDDWKGVVLAHGAQPDLVGKNIWDYEDTNGIKVVQRLIDAAQKPEGDYVFYRWRKPDTGEERPKVSFALGIPAWQWMIGTGVYTDDVEATIAQLQQGINRQILHSVLRTLASSGLVGLLLFLLIRRFYASLRDDLERFRLFFQNASETDALMDPKTLRYREFQLQADHVNDMLGDKLKAERLLRRHQQELTQLVAERTVDLEKKSKELERLATTDALTGLLNRRSFSDRATNGLKEAQRYGHACSLVLLDIDHFKTINDRFGHSAGDAVLVAVAQRLQTQLRGTDLFGRWGGEEFTILLPHTSRQGALELCERFAESLSTGAIDTVGRITASFGVAAKKDGEDLDALLRRADQAMYAAKRAGRNRIEAA